MCVLLGSMYNHFLFFLFLYSNSCRGRLVIEIGDKAACLALTDSGHCMLMSDFRAISSVI